MVALIKVYLLINLPVYIICLFFSLLCYAPVFKCSCKRLMLTVLLTVVTVLLTVVTVLLEYICLQSHFSQALPIMVALCLMLLATHYAQIVLA